MRTVIIIQARMGSSRLPGKVSLDLGGVTALERCIARAKAARRADAVVVATTLDARDDEVVRIALRAGVTAFRGSESDVLSRYAAAAAAESADVIVRVTSDCPLLDPTILDEVIGARAASGADYASCVQVRHLPRGLDVEVFTREALVRADAEARDATDREHVTRYIVQHPERFKTCSVAIEVPRAGLDRDRWTLDTEDDYRFLRELFDLLGANAKSAGFYDVLAIVDANPHLRDLNAHVAQKTT